MVTQKIVIKLLIPVRVNCRTEQLPILPWNGKSALNHVCCSSKYLDTVQTRCRAARGCAILSWFSLCPAGRTAVQLNPALPPPPPHTLPLAVSTSGAMEMHGSGASLHSPHGSGASLLCIHLASCNSLELDTCKNWCQHPFAA